MKILEKEVKNPLTDVFNATNCSRPMEEAIDNTILVVGYVKFTDIDSQTKEEKEYLSLVADNGKCFSTGSPIFIKAFDVLLDTLSDNDMNITNGIGIIPNVQKSKQNKDFYNFTIC